MWVAVAKPKAVLIPVDAEPVKQPDGSTVQVFRTERDERFAQVVEPTGFVQWLQDRRPPGSRRSA